MNITDIPETERYGRDVREGKFGGATHYWCPGWRCWFEGYVEAVCPNKHCGEFWSRAIDPGEGYRLLGLEEIVKNGDEHFGISGKWLDTIPVGPVRHQSGDYSIVFAFRRKVEQPSLAITWPTPIVAKDRLPTKEDANENGYVLVRSESGLFWLGLHYARVKDCNASHWMPQPPAPEPIKSEAELAWEEQPLTHGNQEYIKRGFLLGYTAAKGADAK